MLAWGRERAGLSVSEAAFKLKVRSQQILAWESGGSSPTFLQLQKLATQYGFPPATFYLDAPPTDFNVRKIKDRRTLAKASRGTFSHELRRFLTFAEQRQAWASEYLRSTGARRVRRIPQWPEPANAAELSSKLRTLLRVSRDDLAALNDVRAA